MLHFPDVCTCCNALIDELARLNGTNQFASTGNYLADAWVVCSFFHQVFADNWHTDLTTHDTTIPELKPGRIGRSVTVKIGQFSQNLPPSRNALKAWRALNDPTSPYPTNPPERLAGQPAYVKCVVAMDGDGVTFLWTDSRYRTVNPKFIRLDDGMTMAKAKGTAVRRWDIHETKRLGRYNYDVAIAFARNRLVRLQCLRRGDIARLNTLPTEDFDMFIQMKSASGELEDMRVILHEVEQMALQSPIQKYDITRMD